MARAGCHSGIQVPVALHWQEGGPLGPDKYCDSEEIETGRNRSGNHWQDTDVEPKPAVSQLRGDPSFVVCSPVQCDLTGS